MIHIVRVTNICSSSKACILEDKVEISARLIKLEKISDAYISFNLEAAPSFELLGVNIKDISYCINIKTYDTGTNILENTDLDSAEDFSCDDKWKTYRSLERKISISEASEQIFNVIAKHENTYYLYSRVYIKPDLEIIDLIASCEDFLNKLNSNVSLVLSRDLDCSNFEITSFDKSISNLYLYGNNFKIKNLNIDKEIYSPSNYGFFGSLENSFISNLKFENLVFSFNNLGAELVDSSIYSLGLFGKIKNSLIHSIVAEGIISSNNALGLVYLGSLSGWSINSKILASTTNIILKNENSNYSSDVRIGSFIGLIEDSFIKNSFSRDTIILSDNIGELSVGLFLFASINSTIDYIYTISTVTSLNNFKSPELGILYIDNINSVFQASYFLKNLEISGGDLGYSEEDFALALNFENFDFTNIWFMPDFATAPDFKRPNIQF